MSIWWKTADFAGQGTKAVDARIQRQANLTPREEREAAFLVCWMIALCDGRLWREKSLLQQIANTLDLDKKTARRIELAAKCGKRRVSIPSSEPGRNLMFSLAVSVAASDGNFKDDERRCALQLAKRLGLSANEINSTISGFFPDSKPFKQSTPAAERTKNSDPSEIVDTSPAHDDSEAIHTLVRGLRSEATLAAAAHQFATYIMPFLFIVGAHLVPLMGVVFWSWEVPIVLLVYWSEILVVGLMTILKMRVAAETSSVKTNEAIPFFCIHYGGFTAAIGVFVLFMIAKEADAKTLTGILVWLRPRLLEVLAAVVGIVLEQSYFFVTGFVRKGQYHRTNVEDHFWKPYPNMAAMFLAIVLGGVGLNRLEYERATCVIMMVGLHLTIETLFWAYHLPPWGFLGAVQKVVSGTILGGIFTSVPLFVLSLASVFPLLLLLVIGNQIPGVRTLIQSLSQVSIGAWWVLSFWLTNVLGAVTGGVIGLLVHLEVLSEEFASHLISNRQGRLAFALGGLFLLSGCLTLPLVMSSAQSHKNQTLNASGSLELTVVGSSGKTVEFPVGTTGIIEATATWEGEQPLSLMIRPITKDAIARQDGISPLTAEFEVTEDHLALSRVWTISIKDYKSRRPTRVELEVSFPQEESESSPKELSPIESMD